MKSQRTLFVYMTAVLLLAGILFMEKSAWGQQALPRAMQRGIQGVVVPGNRVPNEKPGEDLANNVFLTPDRATLQLLSQAKELLEKRRYSEAVRNLGAILDGQEDYFFQPTKDRAIHRSLKAEAQRLIGEMPQEGRDIYEASFGDRARAMLSAAVAGGDVAAIAEVARRFFHTKAGYEATFLLGLHHLDHARPLAAALTLQRLKDITYLDRQFEPILSLALASSWLQAGSPEKAKTILIDFKNNNPNRQLVIGGKKVPLFKADAEALDWLLARVGPLSAQGTVEADRWIMFRGDPQRNAASAGSAPLLNLRWEVSAANDPAVEEAVRIFYRLKTDNDQPLLPSSHPLVLDDVVLMRTYRNLVALDFTTGKRIWEVPLEEPAENAANVSNDFDSPFRQNVGVNPASAQSLIALGRAWNDSLFGTLSSDGRLVYSIEDAWTNGEVSVRSVGFNRRQAVQGGAHNYLAARDIHSGKLKWTLGGPNDQFALPQAETFFLGPPLPLLGQLYAIGEAKGEIRLFVFDPDPEKKRDRLLWSQQLSVVESSIQEEPQRRITGISPSYADGILVCPTSTGAIVAVDLATRSLLWGYHYGRETPDRYQTFNARRFMMNAEGVDSSRWSDSSICIADGRVLVSPVDSDELHCLNLADGGVKWKIPRQDNLYIACVYQDNVILVGSKKVSAYRLADGEPAWDGRTVDLPEGTLPSGRGFLSGDKYYLPLNSAEVSAIDLKEGKIVRMSRSQKGDIPGNLVCYKGRILSQNYRGLEAFYQLDAAEAEVNNRLTANPRDAEALCLRGEILLDGGKRGEALECYRKAYEIAAEPRTKMLLRDSLLEGLRTEFAAYRKRGAEIEQLLENSEQRASYLRLMIDGLQKEGDIKSAFGQLETLIDLEPGRLPLESVSKLHSVRRDRWIQARLDALRGLAKPEVAGEMDAAVSARWKTARADGSMEALKTFLGFFDNQPIAAPARAELIEKLKKSGRALDLEMALWQSQPVLSPPTGGPALAEAAEFFRQSGMADVAAESYRWLLSRFGDSVCRNGKTGRQLIAAIPQTDPLHKAIERRDQWPTGLVEIADDSSRSNMDRNSYGRILLEFRGNRGPYFEDRNLWYDSGRSILCTDGLGNELWRFSLSDEYRMQNQFLGSGREGGQIRAWGHVLFIPMTGRLLAIDTLAADRTHPPKVLWTEEGSDVPAEFQNNQQVRLLMNGVAMNWRMQRMGMGYGSNQSGEANFLANRFLCVQRARTLRALNNLDGQTLWQRESLPLLSTIFGDDEYVFVLPSDKPEAMVFRALDGELLGTRKIERRETQTPDENGKPTTTYAPLTADCLAAFGRNLLYWRLKGDQRVLELFDVWQQKSVWPARAFSSKSQYCLLNREVLGILESNGKFTLLSLPDGGTLAETRLEADNNLTELFLIPYEKTYLILTNSSPRIALNSTQSSPISGSGGDKAIQRGRLYAIDRQGKLLWPEGTKVNNQHFVVGQPKGFPALVFAAQTYEVQANRQGRVKVAVKLIDKRTGRIVYDKQDHPQTMFFKVTADPDKKTMQIAMQKNTVNLTFTDKPWPTKEELEKSAAEAKKNSSPKIFNALKNAAEDLFKIPDALDEFEGLGDQ